MKELSLDGSFSFPPGQDFTRGQLNDDTLKSTKPGDL